jgi:hypothetical protein
LVREGHCSKKGRFFLNHYCWWKTGVSYRQQQVYQEVMSTMW